MVMMRVAMRAMLLVQPKIDDAGRDGDGHCAGNWNAVAENDDEACDSDGDADVVEAAADDDNGDRGGDNDGRVGSWR